MSTTLLVLFIISLAGVFGTLGLKFFESRRARQSAFTRLLFRADPWMERNIDRLIGTSASVKHRVGSEISKVWHSVVYHVARAVRGLSLRVAERIGNAMRGKYTPHAKGAASFYLRNIPRANNRERHEAAQ